MKIVSDTNVIISGIFWDGNESEIIKRCIVGELTNFVSLDTLIELERVLRYPKFDLTPEEIEDQMKNVLSFSSVVNPKIHVSVVERDPSDNIFLDCALTAGADFIVSGDEHLLEIREYEGIKILNAPTFLKTYCSE